jgi:hypothetical protein
VVDTPYTAHTHIRSEADDGSGTYPRKTPPIISSASFSPSLHHPLSSTMRLLTALLCLSGLLGVAKAARDTPHVVRSVVAKKRRRLPDKMPLKDDKKKTDKEKEKDNLLQLLDNVWKETGTVKDKDALLATDCRKPKGSKGEGKAGKAGEAEKGVPLCPEGPLGKAQGQLVKGSSKPTGTLAGTKTPPSASADTAQGGSADAGSLFNTSMIDTTMGSLSGTTDGTSSSQTNSGYFDSDSATSTGNSGTGFTVESTAVYSNAFLSCDDVSSGEFTVPDGIMSVQGNLTLVLRVDLQTVDDQIDVIVNSTSGWLQEYVAPLVSSCFSKRRLTVVRRLQSQQQAADGSDFKLLGIKFKHYAIQNSGK